MTRILKLTALLSAALCMGTAQAATITVTAGAVDDDPTNGNCSLVEAISAANTDIAVDACTAGAGPDTLELASNSVYVLTAVNIGTSVDNGLPIFGSEITINGHGSTITRASGAPDFRILALDAGGIVTLNNLHISDGFASIGGGIFNSNGTLTLNNCTVADNEGFKGGGINNSGTLFLTNTTVADNTATKGGGIYNTGTLTLTSSTVSGNKASSAGGGIYIESGSADISFSTVTDNTAPADKGSGIASEAATQLTATIVAGNPTGDSTHTDIDYLGSSNIFTSGDNNLIGTGNATGNFTKLGDQTGTTDPKLADLAEYGGFTKTHLPLPGSPAIDAVSIAAACPAKDQRGIARPQGTSCDIGSVEVANIDFGDAPAPYPTLRADNGAGHVVTVTGPRLGVSNTSEADGQPTAADASDDGVSLPAGEQLEAGKKETITFSSSTSAKLDVWLDLNRDGDWDDAGEEIFADTVVASGSNNLDVTLPTDTTQPGTSYMRVRISTDGGLQPTGIASDGEVEDYKVTLVNKSANSGSDGGGGGCAMTGTGHNGMGWLLLAMLGGLAWRWRRQVAAARH